MTDPARLATLRAMCIRGLPSGPVFDRMTRLAARLLKAPVALGTLVELDRQLLASAYDPAGRYVTGDIAPMAYSFCQHTIAGHDSFKVEDTRKDPLVANSPAVSENGVLAYAGIPLVVGGQPVGALCVLDYVPRDWAEDELDILRDLAAAAVTELELRSALEESEGRVAAEAAVQRLRVIQSVTDTALRDVSLETLFNELLEKIRGAFDADTATLLLTNESGSNLTVRASIGMTPEGDNTSVPVGKGIAGRIASTGAPLIVPDVTAAQIVNPALKNETGSLLGVPLFVDGKVYGVMHVGSRSSREFDADDVRLLELVAERAATAIERALLRERERDALLAAKAGNRAKAEFLSMMSHELRTPLNVIGGYSQLLLEGIKGDVSEAQRSCLHRILDSQQRLLSMIDSTLQYSEIDAGRGEFVIESVDLGGVVSRCVAEIGRAVEQAGLTIEQRCEDGMIALGDHQRIRQIIDALTSNALKFTPRGGLITIECIRSGATLLVSVSDTGVGIPEDKMPEIFARFTQADQSATRRHEGIGLGLAIARALARGMTGDITVTSQEGSGSVFTLSLPGRS